MKLKLALILVKLLYCVVTASAAPNFRVVTQTPHAAEYEARAELYYRKLAEFWTHKPFPQLASPVPITVREGRIGAGGATSFEFDRGSVTVTRMVVQGTKERLLDSAIPHEVNHVVMALITRRPIERAWDEGASSLFEHASEKAMIRKRLYRRGPPIRRFIDAREYPDKRHVLDFYARGAVLTEYLVREHGADKFIAFLKDSRKPSAKLKQFYGMTPEELEIVAFKPGQPQSTTPAAAAKRREVIVFTGKNCEPCKRFQRDQAAGHFTGYQFRVVEHGSPEFAAQAQACLKATGHDPNKGVPTFWVAGSKSHHVGYRGPADFARWLLTLPFRIGKAIADGVHTVIGGGEGFSTDNVSITIGGDDFSGVRVFVAPHRRDLGAVGGLAAGAAERVAAPALARLVRDVTGGKATLVFAPERAHPKRYAALLKAFGREPGEDLVGIVVPRTNRGLAKGVAAKLGEKIARGKLKDAPVDIVFERIDGNVVAAINAASQVAEDVAAPAPDGPPAETFKGELTSIIAAQFKAHAPKNPLPETLQDALADKAAERVVDKLPTDLIPNWLLAALVGSGGVGYSIREFIKHRFDKRLETEQVKLNALTEGKLSVLSLLASSSPNSESESSTPPSSSASSSGSVPASAGFANAGEATQPTTGS
jgi:hypothetical protein